MTIWRVFPVFVCRKYGLRLAVVGMLQLLGSFAGAENIAFSVRALGMGNAFTAVVNDGDSVFYNPGGLSLMSGLGWTIIDPAIGVSNLGEYQTYLDLAQSEDLTSSLGELFGSSLSVYGAGSKTLFSLGGFVVGAYAVGDASLQLSNPSLPSLTGSLRADYGFLAGWGGELLSDILGFGVTVRRITRQGGEVSMGPSDLVELNTDNLFEGFDRTGVGTAVDLGLNLSLPLFLKPSFSLVWRDIGDTNFEATSSLGAPPSTDQELILGAGLSMNTLLLGFSFAIDYRYFGQAMAPGKKINLGAEVSLPIVDIRAGLHQGYFSGGFGFDLWLLRMDFATYVEELGVFSGQLPDRRYFLQLGLHLLFGQSKKSKKRAQKRRNQRDAHSRSDGPSRRESDEDGPRWEPQADEANPYGESNKKRWRGSEKGKSLDRRF